MIGQGDGFKDSYYVDAYRYAAEGLGVGEIADQFGTTTAVIRAWRAKYPDFDKAIKRGISERKYTIKKVGDELHGLTPRQFKFVEEYLQNMNVYQAARRAGYSEKDLASTGRELISNEKVLTQITRRAAEIRGRTDVSKERVIKELSIIAFSNPQRLFDEDGNLIDITAMPEDVARCISSIEVDAKEDGRGVVTTTAKIKTWDKVKALELLARHLLLISNTKQVEQHLHLHQEKNPYDGVDAEDLLKVQMMLDDLRQSNGNGHVVEDDPES